MVEPWYESKLRCTATPPASANAIASFICRRSKYFSRIDRIGADGTVRAQRARPLRVLRPEVEVARGDFRGGVGDPACHQRVVGRDLVHLPPPHVEQQQPRPPIAR